MRKQLKINIDSELQIYKERFRYLVKMTACSNINADLHMVRGYEKVIKGTSESKCEKTGE